MNDPEFLPATLENDDTALIRAGLVRVFNAAMASLKIDEARKALAQLAALLPGPATAGEPHPAELELARVRAHLEPLGLAPEDTPVDELARLAVARIIDQR